MKYLVHPYNKTSFHEKHMSFGNEAQHNFLYSSDMKESQSWKRLFELIIKENKSDMRKFLAHVNQRFYDKLAKIAALEERKKKKKKVKQVTFLKNDEATPKTKAQNDVKLNDENFESKSTKEFKQEVFQRKYRCYYSAF
jgi:hypothetical protein